jgi:protein-tyrosine phosphatase
VLVLSPPEAPPSLVRPVRRRRIGRSVFRAVGGLLLVVVIGNAAIALLSYVARTVAPPAAVPVPVTGIDNLSLVDDRVWRGAAPDLAGFRSLYNAGVTTVVDLRAEADARDLDHELESLGLRVVHLPVRDGQTPTGAQIDTFIAEVGASDGVVFVHCGAGVGRTGAMVGAYRVETGLSTGVVAAAQNLSVGPPSLEQLAFTAGLSTGEEAQRPPGAVVALSRLLDSPRRLMSVLGI